MLTRLNPLDHPVLFTEPRRLTRLSAWHEHIPFAMLLVDLLRPRTFVELGAHSGDSYCAFCQAVAALDLDTRCVAVDTWAGDLHSRSYGPEILRDLKAHHDPLYGAFSELKQCSFDDALQGFADRSVDLLHIDGLHTYEAVTHDFNSWLPKTSARGVVLFHDIAVTGLGFGVKTFWEQVKSRYPSLEFSHGHGLGLLAVGADQPDAMRGILTASAEDRAAIRSLFAGLGQRVSLGIDLQRKAETIADIRRSPGWRILRRLDRVGVHLIPPSNTE
jgi:methyltransferase family protein